MQIKLISEEERQKKKKSQSTPSKKNKDNNNNVNTATGVGIKQITDYTVGELYAEYMRGDLIDLQVNKLSTPLDDNVW